MSGYSTTGSTFESYTLVGDETQLILPSDYNGQGYEIYNYAFCNCTDLTSVTIPDSVTSIGLYASQNCSGLTRIDFDGTKAQWNAASPLAAYFYLLIHLTTSPQFDTIRLYVIVVRYIFRRKTNKSVARGRVRNNKEKRYEKNLPTQKTSKKQSARFPRKNEDNRRSSRACSSSQQGSSRTLRLIEAIREVYLQT